MQLDILWLVVALIIIAIGVMLVNRGWRNRDNTSVANDVETQHKHGLPILARDEREFDKHQVDTSDDDALSNMAAAVSSAPTMVVGQREPLMPTELPTQAPQNEQVQAVQADQQTAPQTTQAYAFESPEYKQPQVSNADIVTEFDQQSPVLDRHLNEQQEFDEDHNPLQDYTDTLTVVITPQYGVGISGRKVLEIARNYGLKYGVMSMFHRHESEDGRGDRWFSMMAEDKNGPVAFDLNTLADDNFTSLILFLVIPHNQLLRGFDSMVSTANLLSQELNAVLTDENRNRLDEDYFVRLRAILANQ